MREDIDIDNFLDNLDKKNEVQNDNLNSVNSNNNNDKSNQNFSKSFEREQNNQFNDLQKIGDEIRDRLTKKEASAFEEEDIKKLKDIYLEISSFDKSLIKNFESIEKESSKILKNVSQKYSKNFIENHKLFETKIKQKVVSFKIEFEKCLKENKFLQADNFLKEIKNQANGLLDKNFYLKEYILNLCGNLEKNFFESFLNYKENKLIPSFKRINIKAVELKSYLEKNSNLKLIEQKVLEIDFELSKLNFYDKFESKNMGRVYEVLILAKQKILEKEKSDEKNIVDKLNRLIENFYEKYVQKDLDDCVVLYKKITDCYELIDEKFFDTKINFQIKLNEIYSNINSLTLSLNVSNFLENYSIGKLIEKSELYLEHTKNPKEIDILALNGLLKEIAEKLMRKKNKELEDIFNKLNDIKNQYLENKKVQKESFLENSKIEKKEVVQNNTPQKNVETNTDENVNNSKNTNEDKIKFIKYINSLYEEISNEKSLIMKKEKARNLKVLLNESSNLKKEKKDKILEFIEEILQK